MAQKLKQYRGLMVIFVLSLAAVTAVFVIRKIDQNQGQTIPPVTESPGDKGDAPVQDEDGPPGLKINLSDGQSQPAVLELLPVKPGEPLSLEEINNILLRLPPLATDPDDRQAFKLPEEVLPPPRTGQTIAELFPLPPEETAPEVLAGPLEVLRYSPEGEVPLAPFINVTFNQPMVPLATLEDLAKEDVPVVIEPSLPGTWRWLGTKTLNFQYDSDLIDRMPMATEYTVTIPAGTTSATGGVLAETVQFKFSTPPVNLQTSYPYSNEPQPLDPTFFASFDQRIDPVAVLKTMEIEVEGKPVSFRMATAEEIEADEDVSRLVENTPEGRWLAFKATELLPKASTITVWIGPNTPSAEGPLLTTYAQTYTFQTYAPLDIVRHGCSWYENECPPLTPFFIEFNNPIDVESYAESMLRVEPEIPGVTSAYHRQRSVFRATVGRTLYGHCQRQGQGHFRANARQEPAALL
jgi:hypothetical protein